MTICNYCEIKESCNEFKGEKDSLGEISGKNSLCNCPIKNICISCLDLILRYETHCNDCKCSYKLFTSPSNFVTRIKHQRQNYRLIYSLDTLGRKQGVCKIFYESKTIGDYNVEKRGYNSYIILQPFVECYYKDDFLYGNYYEYYKINNSVSYSSILYKAGLILCSNGPLKLHIDYAKRLKEFTKPKKHQVLAIDLKGL